MAKSKWRKKGKATITLPGAPPVEPRRTQGMRPPPEDATRTAIDARLRILGRKDTPDNRIAAKSPRAGCGAGRAIMAGDVWDERLQAHRPLTEDESAKLWAAVCHIRRTYVIFDRALGGPPRYAQCLRILLPVEALETSADAPAVDDRTADEKYRAAISAKMALETWLGYTSKTARAVCLRHVVDEVDAPVTDWPALRSALECVCDGLAGRKVQYRG